MGIGISRGAAAALAAALLVGTGGGARAQHVVTEAEAGKLTLEALTAPPPPPRPIYRAYLHRVLARSEVFHETRWDRRGTWHAGHLYRPASERRVIVRRVSSAHHVRYRHR